MPIFLGFLELLVLNFTPETSILKKFPLCNGLPGVPIIVLFELRGAAGFKVSERAGAKILPISS